MKMQVFFRKKYYFFVNCACRIIIHENEMKKAKYT